MMKWRAWERAYAEYQTKLEGYLQDWNENMQRGITRLNTEPQNIGVTPVNGALLLPQIDLTLPTRGGGSLAITRRYNSKIWYSDSAEAATLGIDRLKAGFWMGMGWDLHVGRYWQTNKDGYSSIILENPSGDQRYFKASGYGYLATDGSFNYFKNDTLWTTDGEIMIFTNRATMNLQIGYPEGDYEYIYIYSLKKFIDHNGNVTSFFYADEPYELGISNYFYGLDSIKTSTNEKAIFHYRDLHVGDAYYFVLLDSITYTGYNETPLKIRYRYEFDSTTISPFGCDFVNDLGNFFLDGYPFWYRPTYLLKSVLYPNGDSICYDYNQYYELTGIHHPSGGVAEYVYETDTFFIPYTAAFPPQDSAKPLLHLTRGIAKTKFHDSLTAQTDSISYSRIFRREPANRAMSNADSVTIVDPEGNYQIFIFRASYTEHRAEKNQWNWDNGRLNYKRLYNNNGQLLGKVLGSDFRLISPDSIPVVVKTESYDGLKTYRTTYEQYDQWGNPHLIHELGDIDRSDDDYYIHRDYIVGGTYHSFWLILSADGGYYEGTSTTEFYTQVGIDTLIITRHWSPSDSQVVDTLTYLPCAYYRSIEKPLDTDFGDTLVTVTVEAREYETPLFYTCQVVVDIGPEPPRSPVVAGTARNHYPDKRLYHLVTKEFVSSDPIGHNILTWVNYFYDDTSSIVKGYQSPGQWQNPLPPPMIRGNITRVEQWKDDTSYTRTEYRYDNVGNVVMAISHPEAERAETTFTHYDIPVGPRSPDKYKYAFPWRIVNHLSNSTCSLSIRNEYDLHTGLAICTVDESNRDSTRFEYDILGRLTRIYAPNQSQPTQKIRYFDFTSPEARLDSIKLANNQWLVSKTFYDGFGRVIQTKHYDYQNTKTIIQNFAYNGNGRSDSVGNPYEVSGTSADYTTPVWSQVTRYQYDGPSRLTRITHPDNKNLNIKHFANTDTLIDEKGNRTINIYNAFGAIDTTIDALNNRTSYEYDHLGRLIQVTDAEAKPTKYYYDRLSRLMAQNGPDAKSPYSYGGDSVDVLYEYDNVGNPVLKKDARGWYRFHYDDISRLTKIQLSTNSGRTWLDTVFFYYDSAFGNYGSGYNNPRGRLGKMKTAGVDSALYFYDDQGNLVRKRFGIVGLGGGVKLIDYKYNLANICTLLVSTSGGTYRVKYHYDKLGRLTDIPNLVTTLRYYPAGLMRKIIYANGDIDTFEYDNRLRPTRIKAYNQTTLFDYSYTYEDNSNVASIIDNINNYYTQTFTYDDLNRLTAVTTSAGNQSFTYDDVGNRASKNMTLYQYYANSNRLHQDHRGYTYNYDDLGNITSRSDGANYQYNWDNRLIRYTKGNDTIDFAYNASGLRVKKYYHSSSTPPDEEGGFGAVFYDPGADLGLKTSDSLADQALDIIKVGIKDTLNAYEWTVFMANLSGTDKLKLFITLDLDPVRYDSLLSIGVDTLINSGRIKLPVDTLTRVPKKAGYEYCLYLSDDDYGYYDKNGKKTSKPDGMTIEKKLGKEGWIKVKVTKVLLENPAAMRFTITTFDPRITLPNPHPNTMLQGGSSACDVFPGTNETFSGEINGYVELKQGGAILSTSWTIFYVYDGINPIIEYTADGTMQTKYIYANGRHIARIAGADTHYYHCDALGSPRKVTNESGIVRWQTRYYPFGEMWTQIGSGNSHTFTGKEFDSEMGLNYSVFCSNLRFDYKIENPALRGFCQRYYDPEIGRFMELDPAGSAASSPYAYCANNPLIIVDPTGGVMQHAVPSDEGGGDGYDNMWWAQYNLMKMQEHLDMTNALRELEKIITNIVRNGSIENTLISLGDIKDAESWLLENCEFLSYFFKIANINEYKINETGSLDNTCLATCLNPTTDQSLFDITFGSLQDNNTWSVRAGLAHEFAEIIYCKTWPGVSQSWVYNPKNPGHYFADRYVRTHFVWNSYYGYIGWR